MSENSKEYSMRSKFLSALALTAALAASPAALEAAPDQTLGMAIMSALVEANGTLLSGAGAVSANRSIGTGFYQVFFNRSVLGCDYVATQSNPNINAYDPPLATIATAPGGSADRVLVVVQDGEGTNVDRTFRMIVFCPK
jgi:hypothetical protein